MNTTPAIAQTTKYLILTSCAVLLVVIAWGIKTISYSQSFDKPKSELTERKEVSAKVVIDKRLDNKWGIFLQTNSPRRFSGVSMRLIIATSSPPVALNVNENLIKQGWSFPVQTVKPEGEKYIADIAAIRVPSEKEQPASPLLEVAVLEFDPEATVEITIDPNNLEAYTQEGERVNLTL